MRTLGVESDQIVEQLIVEQIYIGEQQILIDKPRIHFEDCP